jgi:hypothetical protein
VADEKKSFKDLLGEAPLASSENTVTLVGALARSSEPDKFVLAIGQGNSVTLDVAAVKSHKVLGGGVGQLLVELEIDSSQVPEEAKKLQPQMPTTGFADIKHPPLETGIVDSKHPPHETGLVDIKHPYYDKHPWTDLFETNPEFGNPPFSLATAQQAPAESVAAMQATPSATRTFFTWDINTGFRDINTGVRDKPLSDGATGHAPYWD